MKYCFDLAREGGRRVAQILGTEVMDNQEHTLTYQCCMVNIRLPLRVIDGDGDPKSQAEEEKQGDSVAVPRSDVSRVTQYLTSASVTDHSTFIAITFYNSSWWARFSAQIYLELADFEYGAHVLKGLCKKVSQKAYPSTLAGAKFGS
jgi:hypothetical protein